MDWLRRNWPDLAIGIALVAVIAGIIATLLTGGSFFPLGPATPADTPAPPAVATPAPDPTPDPAPVAPPGPAVPDEAAPPTEPAPAAPQPGGVEVLAPDGSPATPPPAAADPAPPAAAASPADPPAEAPPAAAAPASPDPAPAPTPAPPVVATPVPQPPAPAPAPTAVPSASPDPEAPYRVSVGAFGSAENAERQAATFRSAGFPVFTGTQGNLTIVLVGPYESEADALAVATRIRGGGFGIDPVVYRFQPDAASAAGATPAPTTPAPEGPAAAPAPPAAPAPAATPAPAAPPAAPPAGERYVQVGAFATAQSAEPLRERLAGLGFATREIQEDGLVKVLVGPFDAAALAAARQRLDAQGIPHFPR